MAVNPCRPPGLSNRNRLAATHVPKERTVRQKRASSRPPSPPSQLGLGLLSWTAAGTYHVAVCADAARRATRSHPGLTSKCCAQQSLPARLPASLSDSHWQFGVPRGTTIDACIDLSPHSYDGGLKMAARDVTVYSLLGA
eukprot:scaffold5081_cov430-Prasinococcus_capsulatus_cf.AAC.1